jgi:hypothetical protein
MRSNRVRLQVEGLEDRRTPASVAGLAAASLHAAQGAAFFRAIATDPAWIFTKAARTFITAQVKSIFAQAEADLAVIRSARASGTPAGALAGLEANLLANENVARKIGGMVGFAVFTPVVVPPPPTPKPTDAGMVNTMPDPTSSNFLPVGTAGLKSWDVVVGTGTPVAAGDSITIFYTGWLASNGTKFDSRRSPADPITFSLNGLIQGWQQGIPGMKPGGIRRLFIPAALGYGAAGSPPNIPANADLVFEIKLISHHA